MEIGAATAANEKSVASDDERMVTVHIYNTAWCVARSGSNLKFTFAKGDRVPMLDSDIRYRNGCFRDDAAEARHSCFELTTARDVVCMDVGVENELEVCPHA